MIFWWPIFSFLILTISWILFTKFEHCEDETKGLFRRNSTILSPQKIYKGCEMHYNWNLKKKPHEYEFQSCKGIAHISWEFWFHLSILSNLFHVNTHRLSLFSSWPKGLHNIIHNNSCKILSLFNPRSFAWA